MQNMCMKIRDKLQIYILCYLFLLYLTVFNNKQTKTQAATVAKTEIG